MYKKVPGFTTERYHTEKPPVFPREEGDVVLSVDTVEACQEQVVRFFLGTELGFMAVENRVPFVYATTSESKAKLMFEFNFPGNPVNLWNGFSKQQIAGLEAESLGRHKEDGGGSRWLQRRIAMDKINGRLPPGVLAAATDVTVAMVPLGMEQHPTQYKYFDTTDVLSVEEKIARLERYLRKSEGTFIVYNTLCLRTKDCMDPPPVFLQLGMRFKVQDRERFLDFAELAYLDGSNLALGVDLADWGGCGLVRLNGIEICLSEARGGVTYIVPQENLHVAQEVYVDEEVRDIRDLSIKLSHDRVKDDLLIPAVQGPAGLVALMMQDIVGEVDSLLPKAVIFFSGGAEFEIELLPGQSIQAALVAEVKRMVENNPKIIPSGINLEDLKHREVLLTFGSNPLFLTSSKGKIFSKLEVSEKGGLVLRYEVDEIPNEDFHKYPYLAIIQSSQGKQES